MKKINLSYPILFALTLILTACGSDGTDIPKSTTSLTDTQKDSVAYILAEGAFSFPSNFLTTLTESETIDETEDCPESGTYTLKGDIEYNVNDNDDVEGNYTLTQSFNDCELMTSDEEQVILNGSLKAKTKIDLYTREFDMDNYPFGKIIADVTGGLDVSGTDVEDGVCGIDLNIETTIAAFTGIIEYSGKLCGDDYDSIGVPFA